MEAKSGVVGYMRVRLAPCLRLNLICEVSGLQGTDNSFHNKPS
jgi:hypothetical protein